jgi:ubiquinone/menaquinone biosynthesis C-methylase UbiE
MCPAHPATPDTVDWNEVWKARQRRHDAAKFVDDTSHNWNRRENAARYDANATREYDERVQVTIAGLDLTRDFRVVDVGAGPGTLAIPLAPLVREITAIEPGAGMVAVMTEHIQREQITNITFVQKLWEDVDPMRDLAGPYDIVIASLSLTMEDIRTALQKMDAVARHAVYLYWFADMPFWERMYADLWESLHGSTYYPAPKADCLWNVLYQMGIYANVEMLPLAKEYRFATDKEMTTFFRARFGVMTARQRKVLDAYLAPLIRHEGGDFVISGRSTLAKVWWKKAA